jgi:uncharacterized protein (DUF58 family)
VHNNDKVGLILFTDQVELYVPPRKGRRHVLRLVREILGFEPGHRGTDVVQALDFTNQVLSRRAIVFLLSDFQSTGDPAAALASLRRAIRQTNCRHDLVTMRIHDPREEQLSDFGLLSVEDSETGELLEVDTGDENVRKRFSEVAHEHSARLRRAFSGEAVDSLSLSTAEPYLPALMGFFKHRERRH